MQLSQLLCLEKTPPLSIFLQHSNRSVDACGSRSPSFPSFVHAVPSVGSLLYLHSWIVTPSHLMSITRHATPRHATGGNRRHLFHFEGGACLGDAGQQVWREGQAAAAYGRVLVLRGEGAAHGGAKKRERHRRDKGVCVRERERERRRADLLVLCGAALAVTFVVEARRVGSS